MLFGSGARCGVQRGARRYATVPRQRAGTPRASPPGRAATPARTLDVGARRDEGFLPRRRSLRPPARKSKNEAAATDARKTTSFRRNLATAERLCKIAKCTRKHRLRLRACNGGCARGRPARDGRSHLPKKTDDEGTTSAAQVHDEASTPSSSSVLWKSLLMGSIALALILFLVHKRVVFSALLLPNGDAVIASPVAVDPPLPLAALAVGAGVRLARDGAEPRSPSFGADAPDPSSGANSRRLPLGSVARSFARRRRRRRRAGPHPAGLLRVGGGR